MPPIFVRPLSDRLISRPPTLQIHGARLLGYIGVHEPACCLQPGLRFSARGTTGSLLVGMGRYIQTAAGDIVNEI